MVSFLQAEISLCRVYKRSGVEDHPSLPRSLQTRSTSRTSNYHINQQSQNSPSFNCFEGQSSHHTDEKPSDTTSCTPTAIVGTSLGLSNPLNSSYNNVIATPSSTIFPNSVDDLPRIISSQRVLDTCPPSQLLNIHNYHLGDSSNYSPHLFDNMLPQPQQQQQLQPQLSSQALLALNNNLAGAGAGAVHVTFPERIWEWNSMLSEGSKDLTAPFK